MMEAIMTPTSSPKAAVLLSSYNGAAYLREQLDSILVQTYDNLHLYIRDDGSTDETPQILAEYAAKNPAVTLIPSGKNLGYPACFYALTDLDIDADYFFFSDQDDVWYPDKVARAVARLECEDPDRILAYFASYNVCDEQLHFLEQSPDVRTGFCLRNTMFEVCGLEFTMAVNLRALLFLRDNKPVEASARGTWMCMLFSAFGKIVYDNTPCASYRRHGSAVTAIRMSGLRFWIWRIRNFFGNGQFKEYRVILRDFYRVTGDRLSQKDRRMLSLFCEKPWFPYVFARVFYPKRLRRKLLDELALRAVFLINQL